MVNVDVDVMINDGRTYYGRVRGQLHGSLVVIEGKVKEVPSEEQVRSLVLSKMPSLRNKKFRVYNN